MPTTEAKLRKALAADPKRPLSLKLRTSTLMEVAELSMAEGKTTSAMARKLIEFALEHYECTEPPEGTKLVIEEEVRAMVERGEIDAADVAPFTPWKARDVVRDDSRAKLARKGSKPGLAANDG